MTAESLRKLDIVVGDVAAIRTAQFRTMHVVAGIADTPGVILDKQDTFGAKQNTFGAKVESVETKVEEIKARVTTMKTGFLDKLDGMKSDLESKLDLLMKAVHDLKN